MASTVPYLSLRQAAELSGLDQSVLRRACLRWQRTNGHYGLQAGRPGRDWLTTHAWLDAYLRNRWRERVDSRETSR